MRVVLGKRETNVGISVCGVVVHLLPEQHVIQGGEKEQDD